MAKRTTFLAPLPQGGFDTRTSTSRSYTHAIIVRPSYEAALKGANQPHGWAADNFAYYQRELDPATRRFSHSDANLSEMAEVVAKHGTAAAYVEALRLEAVAQVEARKAEGYYDRFQAVTWCGRLDLAQKALCQYQAKEYYAEARMVPTQVK